MNWSIWIIYFQMPIWSVISTFAIHKCKNRFELLFWLTNAVRKMGICNCIIFRTNLRTLECCPLQNINENECLFASCLQSHSAFNSLRDLDYQCFIAKCLSGIHGIVIAKFHVWEKFITSFSTWCQISIKTHKK